MARRKSVPAVKRASIPNLDPGFFLPLGSGETLSAAEIEEHAYKYHPWIHAAARCICMNLSRLPKILREKQNPEKTTNEHEILSVLSNPNPLMDEMLLWQAVILGLLLPSKSGDGKTDGGGQVFLLGADNAGNPVDFRKGNIPVSLWPYTDKYVTAKRDSKGQVVEWIYEVPGKPASKLAYKPAEVIRIVLFNPYDWTLGIPWYTPARVAVLQDIKSDIFNTMFFDNDARPSGLLTTEQQLTDEQQRVSLKRWYEQHGGPGRAGKIAMLSQGLKYDQMSELHRDMQFIEQKNLMRKSIIAAFGLNEIALGNYESINFATIREGRRMLWQDTYAPLDQLIWNSINDQWIAWVDNGKWLGASDYSGIEALRPDYDARAKTAEVMVRGLKYTPALASQLVGIPLTEETLKKYPWLDEKQEIPAPLIGSDEEEADSKKKPEDKDKGKAALVVPSRRSVVLPTADERLRFSWDYIHRVLDPGEKRFIRDLERIFTSQRNRMQDRVDAWLDTQNTERKWERMGGWNAVTRAIYASPELFLLDLMGENKVLEKLWAPLVKDQLTATTAKLEEEIGPLVEWGVTDDRIAAYVAARKQQIKGINTTTFEKARDKIGAAIDQAITENATPQEAAKLIKAAISETGEIRKHQSKMIARTETGTISSQCRFDVFRVEGFEYHEWVTAGDEKVRTELGADHVAAGSAGPIRIGDVFPGTTNLRFPLDPRGEPGNIINCRCVAVAAEPT